MPIFQCANLPIERFANSNAYDVVCHRETANENIKRAARFAVERSPHFEQYAKNGLFGLIETRSPEIYELLEV